MRISRIDIASYGRIRDRRVAISPGLTVIHGPNESGKTTVMEFIRNTLVPTNKRDVYPERARTDTGSITYEEDGEEGTITLAQKARGGDVPDCISRLEPDLFRSVFAMGQRDLDDDRVVTSGDISSRFLSVPGGDSMPSAMDSISGRVDSKVGKTSRSPSELNDLDGRLASLDSDIAGLRASAESYGVLARRRDSLKTELEEAGRDAEASRRDSEIISLYESQRENYRRLSSARAELNGLGDFRRVSKADSDKAVSLEADLRNARSNLDSDKAETGRLKEAMGGIDPDAVSGIRGRMSEVIDGRGRYRLESSKPREESVPRKSGGPKAALLAGVLMIVLGIVAATVTPYALALSAVGAVVAVAGVRRQPVASPSVPAVDVAFIESYERNVREICTKLGIHTAGIEQAVDSIISVADSYDRLRDRAPVSSRIRDEYLDRRSVLDSFYSGYSGKDGFGECIRKTAREAELRTAINHLRDAIRSSGLDPEQSKCPVEARAEAGPDITRISSDIGSLEAEMRHVLDTRELDSLMDSRESLEEERRKVLMEGAVAVLAMSIASEACDDAYSNIQPGVAATADRFLSMMTSGRYRIDMDPRRKDVLAVSDGDEVKGPKRWSTGLRAQVLLSMKLAVAKELGDGKVPMILDDVLLPFDPDRMEGAVRALAEVSREMQVIMFTCDPAVADVASELQDVSVVRLEALNA